MGAAFGSEIGAVGAAIVRCRVNFAAKNIKINAKHHLICSIKQGPAEVRNQ